MGRGQPTASPGRRTIGGDGFRPEQVVDIQRARILAAMAEVATEHGAGNVTVAHIVARSGVSRRTFYELFADREECFVATFEDAVEWIAAAVAPVYRSPGRWRERIASSLMTLLGFFDEEPGVARLVIVEALGAGPGALEGRRRMLAPLIAAIDDGRAEIGRRQEPPPLTAEGVVGAVFAVIHSRLLEESHRTLVGLTGQLMSMIVLPYLGPLAARKELARPAPKRAPRRARETNGNPLEGLDMRLTYRTVRVLLTIGAHSGASNRRVADEAGIVDQGQVSKLLARLEKLGLIENVGQGRAKGVPNAWALTARGRQIEQTIERQTTQPAA